MIARRFWLEALAPEGPPNGRNRVRGYALTRRDEARGLLDSEETWSSIVLASRGRQTTRCAGADDLDASARGLR